MKVTEAKKILTLTRAEQETIHDLYEIFENDTSLDTIAVWAILTDIYRKSNNYADDYGYRIDIVD